MRPAYFDSATATPLHPVARQALLAALDDGWADPGKLYSQARRARQLLDAARDTIAFHFRVSRDELTFTPGGTFAVHSALAGGLEARSRVGRTLVHSAIEHSAVLDAARRHVHSGGSAVEIPVDQQGHLDGDAFEAAVRQAGVALAALISASHEVGTRQPVGWAGEVCAAAGVPLHVDASVSVGWDGIPENWSLLSASARKWGGPPGVGVLAVRKGVRYLAPYPATSAPDLPALVAAAASLHAVMQEREQEAARLSRLIDQVRETVAATVPDVEVVGDPVDRLPHIVTFSCLYVDGEALLHALDRRGFAVSSGSACTSDQLRPSHVLAAMGVLTHGNVRISLHRDTTAEDVERFLAELPGIVAALRAEVGM